MDLGTRDTVAASSKESTGRMDPGFLDGYFDQIYRYSHFFLPLPFRARFPLSFSDHREFTRSTVEKTDEQGLASRNGRTGDRSGALTFLHLSPIGQLSPPVLSVLENLRIELSRRWY